MRIRIFFVSALLLSFPGFAVEDFVVDDVEPVEGDCEGDDVCIPPENGYIRLYRCPPGGCRYYYDYLEKESEVTWPGKFENSFMDELMR